MFGEYDYDDTGRGAGLMRVEGFSEAHVRKINDWFRILELGREVGYARPPKPSLDTRSQRGFLTPLLPFVFLILLSIPVVAVTVLSLAGLLSDKGGIWIAGVVIEPLLLVGIVLTGLRLRWFFRLRRRVAETGERMPYGLGAAD